LLQCKAMLREDVGAMAVSIGLPLDYALSSGHMETRPASVSNHANGETESLATELSHGAGNRTDKRFVFL
jgi:hypothetical protein